MELTLQKRDLEQVTADARYYCPECSGCSVQPGRCTRCGEAELMDLALPETRDWLLQDDLRRATRHERKFYGLGVLLGIPLFFLMPGTLGVIMWIFGGLLIGATFLHFKPFRRKLPYIPPEVKAQLPARKPWESQHR